VSVTHEEQVVRKSSRRADEGQETAANRVRARHLARLVEFTEPELDPEDVVLEVSAGTAPYSRAIARRVRHVTVVGRASALLEQGKRALDAEGVTNVTFARCDAADLPHLDRSFTLVITRLALHRVLDPAAVIAELARVSRPGAALVVADLLRPEDVDDPDRIERLRDPGHRELLSADQITGLLADSGAEVKRTDRFESVRPVKQWLEAAGTPEEDATRIRRELDGELDGGPPTGMRPTVVEGELHLTHAYGFFCAIAS
jgi:ubiquinone/menaquinone biosynthesis C-methylase UbiE